MTHDTTIAAIATPPGSGGIGIIKISGPEAVSLAARVFKAKGSRNPLGGAGRSFQSHRLYFGHIVHPVTDQILDEVLLVVMPAPHSYTREDVVEIQAHAGTVGLRAILNLILDGGARLAEPGEFTQRAFLNGRIDLTQAEAVIDLINARSDIALTAAARQMNGDLTSILTGIENALRDLRVIVEAGIDFPDDVQGDGWGAQLLPRFRQRVIAPIDALIHRYEKDHVFRDGLHLAIIGKPNVGKSSLMNCLLGRDRAIVTDRPGTTRDLIEDSLKINGIPVNLIDTAGLHDTDDPIESLGIQKTRQGIAAAQQVLFVVEGHKPLTDADLHIYAACRSKEMVLVLNKMDLAAAATAQKLPAHFNGIPRVPISALYHRGIDALKDAIVAPVIGENRDRRSHGAIPNLRHKVALERALNSAQAVATGIAEQRSAELIAIDLKEALDAILDISGRRADGDVLDAIFRQFCIGK